MESLYDPLVGAAAAAAFAGLGFLIVRFYFQPRAEKKSRARKRRRSLETLKSLLGVSGDAFSTQNKRARTLVEKVRHNHPDIVTTDETGRSLGFDEIFHRAYSDLQPEEMELFQLIRGTTMTSLYDTNKKMYEWIEGNSEFLAADKTDRVMSDLAEDLIALRSHLRAWLDKYSVWIPDKESRSIVYLADEKKHGTGFPRRLERSLDAALAKPA